MTPTGWIELGGDKLLGRSQQLIDVANQIVVGRNALVAEDYGITSAAVSTVATERADYDEIVNAPSAAIAMRTALTKGFRPAFGLLDAKFAELSDLILQFGGTDAGKAMIAAWRDGLVIKGLGQGASAKTSTGAVTPAQP